MIVDPSKCKEVRELNWVNIGGVETMQKLEHWDGSVDYQRLNTQQIQCEVKINYSCVEPARLVGHWDNPKPYILESPKIDKLSLHNYESNKRFHDLIDQLINIRSEEIDNDFKRAYPEDSGN